MDLFKYFRSIIEQDQCAVVICNLEHTIIYMNPAAIIRYKRYGGAELIGKSLLECHNSHSREKIEKVLLWFKESDCHNRIYTFHNEKERKDVYIIALRDKDNTLIGYYEKHEYRREETKKLYDFEA